MVWHLTEIRAHSGPTSAQAQSVQKHGRELESRKGLGTDGDRFRLNISSFRTSTPALGPRIAVARAPPKDTVLILNNLVEQVNDGGEVTPLTFI